MEKVHSVEETIRSYFKCFGAGDAQGISSLFSENANLMPNGMSTVRGREAIRSTFDTIVEKAHIRFDEVGFDQVQEFGDTAVVETHTAETITRTGADVTETGVFRELFCLHRADADWEIVSYMGNRGE